MFYIVGLGNPGADYAKTRHNIGWMMLDELISISGLPQPVVNKNYNGAVSVGKLGNDEVTILYPHTFMNDSGAAVKKIMSPAEAARLIVVYDDVDLPLGEIKISAGRGSGGHNGVASIINILGTKDFLRIRVGIARRSFWTNKVQRPAGDQLAKYVLRPFSASEQAKLPEIGRTVAAIIEKVIEDGPAAAMNTYNSKQERTGKNSS